MTDTPDTPALLNAFTGVVGPLLERTGAIFSSRKVPFSQARLLLTLHEQGVGQPMVALARTHGVVPRTMTSLVDGLEKRGLVSRAPDPTDRRVVLVSMTAEGTALARQVDQATADFAEEAFAPLSAPERAALSELLAKIRKARADGEPGG